MEDTHTPTHTWLRPRPHRVHLGHWIPAAYKTGNGVIRERAVKPHHHNDITSGEPVRLLANTLRR